MFWSPEVLLLAHDGLLEEYPQVALADSDSKHIKKDLRRTASLFLQARKIMPSLDCE
jgi:hypothetical protein